MQNDLSPHARHLLVNAGLKAVKAALVSEAANGRGRSFEQWSVAESKTVWAATCEFARQHGLRTPTFDEVVRVELQASGHSDYAHKWCLFAIELTFKPAPAAVQL